jgi:hypothetical protein
LASRTKNTKSGRSRGEPSPRGKRGSSSPAGQAGPLNPPQLPDRTEAAPELIGKLPDVAAVPPRPDEVTIVAEVSTTALTAATQAAEGIVPAIEAHLPAGAVAGPSALTAETTSPMARPVADAEPAPSSAEGPVADAPSAAPTRKPTRPRLVSSSPETPAPSPSASREPAQLTPPPPAPKAFPTARPGEREKWSAPGGAEGIFGHAAARSAAIATLGLLDLNTRVLDLMRQQSEVSLSALGAVLTARSAADAMRAQTDGLSRTLDLQSTQWNEIARTFRRVVEDAAEPVRAATLWRAP